MRGGGASAHENGAAGTGAGGGSGGFGAGYYRNEVVQVTGGEVLTIDLGRGGAGYGNGTSSRLLIGETVIIEATGGSQASPGVPNGRQNNGGSGATSPITDRVSSSACGHLTHGAGGTGGQPGSDGYIVFRTN